jgi:hypothetical protein
MTGQHIWIIVREDDTKPGAEIFQVYSTKELAEARVTIERAILKLDKTEDFIHFHIFKHVLR